MLPRECWEPHSWPLHNAPLAERVELPPLRSLRVALPVQLNGERPLKTVQFEEVRAAQPETRRQLLLPLPVLGNPVRSEGD